MLRSTRVLYPAPTATDSAASDGNPITTTRMETPVDFFAGKPESFAYGTLLRPSPQLAATAMSAVCTENPQPQPEVTHTTHLTSSTQPVESACDASAAPALAAYYRAAHEVSLTYGRRGGDRAAAAEADARQALLLQTLTAECLAAARAETIARNDLERDLLCRLCGLYDWCHEMVDEVERKGRDANDPFSNLETRLAARQAATDADQRSRETAWKEDGRRAWQEEVAQQRATAQIALVRVDGKKREDDGFRAAMVFLVVDERKQRDALNRAVDEAYSKLVEDEAVDRKESARLACERFMNTPEQLAITAALQRRVNALRKRWANHNAEQAVFLSECHHGTGGQSVFTGSHARKICTRCRVRFDDGLGFYVRMDRPLPVALPSLQRAIEDLEAPRFPPEWGDGSAAGAAQGKRESALEGRRAQRATETKRAPSATAARDRKQNNQRTTSSATRSAATKLPAVSQPRRSAGSGGCGRVPGNQKVNSHVK